MKYNFLTLDDILELHKIQIENYGGADGIRDSSLLESAVMVPQASFDGIYVHKNIFEVAAAYAFHIAENQPFIDGNKRTGLATALVFLDWHNFEVEDSDEILYNAMIDISIKKINKLEFAKILESISKAI